MISYYYPNIPFWKGEDLRKKNILVYEDQGIGDSIQFSKFLFYLNKICTDIRIEVRESVVKLFQKNIPQKILEPTQILTNSILFKYIRHPMYLGILLNLAFSTTTYTEIYFFNLIFLYIYIQIGIYYEEKQLIRVHKEQYLSYLKKYVFHINTKQKIKITIIIYLNKIKLSIHN